MNDNLISQIEGATLILTILLFIYFSLKRKEASVNDDNFNIPKVSKFKILFWLIISSISLYAGSEFLVDGAVKLAKELSISEAVISVSVIAIGTSVPELATSVVAIVKKEKGIFGTATNDEINELKEEGIKTEIIPWVKDKSN